MTIPSRHIDLEHFLKTIPLFSSISHSQILDIAACFHFSEFKKDSLIFRQGDMSNSMYIIRSGTVLIYSEGDSGSFQTELRRGDFFGEMALLSDLPRTANAKVTLDAKIFRLKKKDFETLLSKNKHIGLFLSRLYVRRLSQSFNNHARPRKSSFYTLSATDKGLGLSHLLYSMSYHISTESDKKVLVVEPHLTPERLMAHFEMKPTASKEENLFGLIPPCADHPYDFKWFYHPSKFFVLQLNKMGIDKITPRLPLLMEKLKEHYAIVIFNLSSHFGPFEQQAARLCDKNFILINNTPKMLENVKLKLKQLEKKSGIGLDRVRAGVSHLCGFQGMSRQLLKKELNLSETPSIWVDRCDTALMNVIDTQKQFPIKGPRALARELAGIRMGLALGAGAARGWSHIGILQVLQEQGIPIDMIAGTSMGALVGAIFSARGSVDLLKKHTIDQVPTRSLARKKIFDYALPFQGFLKGKKTMNLVASAVDHADFMDLLIPTYLVGVDIMKGEEVLFETGDVSKAVRSSLSLPIVFTPFRHQGRWMVDGGLLNPVPVNILEQKGADKIIAVCVESQGSNSEQTNKAPGIMGVISKTISIVHGRATSGFAKKSDLVIYPDVNGVAWDDFHKGDLLVKRGIKACTDIIEEIKSLVR